MNADAREFLRILIIGAVAGAIAGAANYFISKEVRSIL